MSEREKSTKKNVSIKYGLIAVSAIIGLMVVAYLFYEFNRPSCETIFEQTSVQFGAKIKLLETQGEATIGRQKIQDLTEAAQITALNLKTCCIVLNSGALDANQFLECKDTAKKYEKQLELVLTRLKELDKAKKAGNTKAVEEKQKQINETVAYAKNVSTTFQQKVEELPKQVPEPKPIPTATNPDQPDPTTPESALKLRTVLQEGGEPLIEDLRYWVYEAQKDSSGNRREITNTYDAQPLFKLPAGRYYVWVNHGNAGTDTEVALTAGKLTEHTINLNAGYLRLAAVAAEGGEPLTKDLRYWVYEAEKDLSGNRREITNTYDAQPLFKLPAGQYYIWATHGDFSDATEAEVRAGESSEVILTLKHP